MKKVTKTESFILTFLNYLDYATLHGLKFLRNVRLKKIQRILWSLFIIITIAFAVYVISFAWFSFTSNPTITSLKNSKGTDFKYPAIGLCNANKISKAESVKFIRELSRKSNIPEETLLPKIELFGALFDVSSVDYDEAVDFQNTLDKFDSNKSTGLYDIRSVMEKLAPKCHDLLAKCEINGYVKDCTTIFTKKILASGFCCVYRSESQTTLSTASSFRFVLNISRSDYFYNDRNSIGVTVQIFKPNNSFTDTTTGSVKEIFISESQNIDMIISSTILTSADSVRSYSAHQRQCLYPDELPLEYGTKYSYSECLSKCKLRSVQALCNCIPYLTPNEFIRTNTSTSFCTLSHIACLNRYRVTWNTYRPQLKVTEGLEREMEDSLNCPDCLPLCTNTYYDYQVTFSVFNLTEKLDPSFANRTTTDVCDTCSVLKIKFSIPNTSMYGKDVIYTWYEIMGNFGGLLGICIGCSIVGIIEVFYFILVKFPTEANLIRCNYNQNKISEFIKKVVKK